MTTAVQAARPQDSIFQGVKYIYAENLKGKAVSLVISRVVGGIEFTDGTGRKNRGFDIHFAKTDKVLGVCGITVRRQLAATCGTDDTAQWVGKTITLYPVKSAKAATGWAIRVQVNPQSAQRQDVPDDGLDADVARQEAEEAKGAQS
jgi:hypothetical protein